MDSLPHQTNKPLSLLMTYSIAMQWKENEHFQQHNEIIPPIQLTRVCCNLLPRTHWQCYKNWFFAEQVLFIWMFYYGWSWLCDSHQKKKIPESSHCTSWYDMFFTSFSVFALQTTSKCPILGLCLFLRAWSVFIFHQALYLQEEQEFCSGSPVFLFGYCCPSVFPLACWFAFHSIQCTVQFCANICSFNLLIGFSSVQTRL